MPIIPSVSRNISEPRLQDSNISPQQFAGDDSVQKATKFAMDATTQYALNEKKQFDLARLTEARNILDVRETQLASAEDGWQNKLGQNAVLFKDEEGNDFMSHYSNRYQKSVAEVATQLQLTPDQKKIFDSYAQEKSSGFNAKLMQHQLRQGNEYKVSVFENSIDIATKKAQGEFTDFNEMDKTIEQMTADVNALGDTLGWSNVERSRKVADQVNSIHANNVGLMLESGDFRTAEAYVNQYGGKMSQLQKAKAENSIKKLKDNFVTNQIIQMESGAMSTGSNPAFNSSDLETLKATSKIDPVEFGSLKYSDPRLDSLAVVSAKDLGMDWAIPLVTAIRVAGEKSNNNQKSPVGASGVYQFTPIAIEQVRRITGKKIDPTNPEEATWGALKFIEWISKKYNTQDPSIIASFYNGGGNHIPQMRKGGVDAIANDENRNYVKRIQAFDFNNYASKAVAPNGLNLNIDALDPSNQAKIISNRQSIAKAQKQAQEENQKQIYEKMSDLLEAGNITFEQISVSPEVLNALDAKQLNSLRLQDKAKKTGDSSTQLVEVYQNPSALKGMAQGEFNTMIANSTPAEQKELSKMYAKANGRDIEAMTKAEEEAKKKFGATSIVSNKMIFDVVNENSGSLGFTGRSANQKVKNSTKDSAFYIAMKNDIYERVSEYDKQYFQKNGKHLSEFQAKNVARSFMEASRTEKGSVFGSDKKVRVYDPNSFNRSDVPDGVKTNIQRLAAANGQRYPNADALPDSLFMKYYFQFYRGKIAR